MALLGGCGLTLDLSPSPGNGEAGTADGSADARLRDGGAADGAPVDASRECRRHVDCDDEDACTGVELCQDGVCVAGDAIVCDDGDPCNGTGECTDGVCSVTPVVSCDDGDDCNGLETCEPFIGCVSGVPMHCDDGIDCTVDSCASGRCENVPDDGLCTAGGEPGTCQVDAGGCQYDTCEVGVTCIGGPCVDADCGPDGTCMYVARCTTDRCCGGTCVTDVATACDDGNACTDDVCDPVTGCANVEHTRACDDGNACTGGDRCAGGTCMPGTATLLCNDLNPCTSETCSPTAGCVPSPLPDGYACSPSADPCVVGACSGGVCTGAAPRCDDSDPCTTDTCSLEGECAYANAGGMACDSGTCDSSGVCVCRSGWFDCDGDNSCECSTACLGGSCDPLCGGSVCGPTRQCCIGAGGVDTCCLLTDIGCCLG